MATERQPSALPKNSWDLTIQPKNDILEEIHSLREAYAARLGFDLERIFDDLKTKEANNPAPRADLKPARRNVSRASPRPGSHATIKG
jgi:hypothetical protein